MRVAAALLVGAALWPAAAAYGQVETEAAYTEVFYPSGALRIQAYLYQPAGSGPFPVVIYNHGSREGNERRPTPFQHIGRLLTGAGYLVLVPERRGYGNSDGPTSSSETGGGGQRVTDRLQAETDDVLAAVDYLRTLPVADMKRLGIMGWSFGGAVTMFAVSRSAAFAAAVNQAGGALTWNFNGAMRNELAAAARKTTTPTLLMVAQNDRTTASITTLADIYKERGIPHRTVIYEPFVPQQGSAGVAPGHMVFSSQGVQVWQKDALEFLDRYLGGK